MAAIVLQSRYASLIAGVCMCATGMAIFTYLSPVDFLEPGFVRDGILIQDQYVSPHESLEVMLDIAYPLQSVTISVDNPLYDIPLRLEIKDPVGIIVSKSDSSKLLKATFRTENLGKYTVTITNLGSETTKITVPYGHNISQNAEQETYTMLGVLWILLIIIGSYLIIHTDFKVLAKARK